FPLQQPPQFGRHIDVVHNQSACASKQQESQNRQQPLQCRHRRPPLPLAQSVCAFRRPRQRTHPSFNFSQTPSPPPACLRPIRTPASACAPAARFERASVLLRPAASALRLPARRPKPLETPFPWRAPSQPPESPLVPSFPSAPPGATETHQCTARTVLIALKQLDLRKGNLEPAWLAAHSLC